MNRIEILKRVNKGVYEGLYTYEDIVDDLDDSIDRINETLNTKYPYISEVLVDDTTEYKYAPDETKPLELRPIFPPKYIRTICVNYIIMELMRREDEFGMTFQTAENRFNVGLEVMFRDMFSQVPKEFQDVDTGFVEFDGGVKPKEEVKPHHWGFDD